MTKQTYKDKNENEWSWIETPEAIEALKKLHESVKTNNNKSRKNGNQLV